MPVRAAEMQPCWRVDAMQVLFLQDLPTRDWGANEVETLLSQAYVARCFDEVPGCNRMCVVLLQIHAQHMFRVIAQSFGHLVHFS